jgi:hypothetical protein
MSERVASSRAAYRAAYHYAAMAELDHLQADVLKDLSKMVIAGVGMILLLALLLWGLVTSAEAVGSGATARVAASAALKIVVITYGTPSLSQPMKHFGHQS